MERAKKAERFAKAKTMRTALCRIFTNQCLLQKLFEYSNIVYTVTHLLIIPSP